MGRMGWERVICGAVNARVSCNCINMDSTLNSSDFCSRCKILRNTTRRKARAWDELESGTADFLCLLVWFDSLNDWRFLVSHSSSHLQLIPRRTAPIFNTRQPQWPQISAFSSIQLYTQPAMSNTLVTNKLSQTSSRNQVSVIILPPAHNFIPWCCNLRISYLSPNSGGR